MYSASAPPAVRPPRATAGIGPGSGLGCGSPTSHRSESARSGQVASVHRNLIEKKEWLGAIRHASRPIRQPRRGTRLGCRVPWLGCRVPRPDCRVSRPGCRLPRLRCRGTRLGCRAARLGCRAARPGCRVPRLARRVSRLARRMGRQSRRRPTRPPGCGRLRRRPVGERSGRHEKAPPPLARGGAEGEPGRAR